MKILLVGDNRTSGNWGGRGGSIALRQILSKKFERIETIRGSAFHLSSAGYGYINTFMPSRQNELFMFLLNNRHRKRVFDWYVKLEEMFGAKDFISENPIESLENFFRNYSKYGEMHHLLAKMKEADIIVINGEGDMVFTTPPRRQVLFQLFIIALAVNLGKSVFFVNAMISDCPITGRNQETFQTSKEYLKKCNAVSVRDPLSFEILKNEMQVENIALIPDSLFGWFPVYEKYGNCLPENGDFIIPHPEEDELFGKLNFKIPYVCLGGSALAAQEPERAITCYADLISELKKCGYPVYLTENDGPDSFLRGVAKKCGLGLVPVTVPIYMAGAILSNARLFISGRYHAAIFASLGGTPCIFMGTVAHKMNSLQMVLACRDVKQFSAFPQRHEILEIGSFAQKLLKEGKPKRDEIKGVVEERSKEAWGLNQFIENHL